MCLNRTLGGSNHEWPVGGTQQLAQLKFEVEAKLRRFYLQLGMPVDFVFALVHKRDRESGHTALGPKYPDTAGYYVLVRDRRGDAVDALFSPAELRTYLESVIATSIDTEFGAYLALPDIDERPLLQSFQREGGAYRDLMHTLTQLKKRG